MDPDSCCTAGQASALSSEAASDLAGVLKALADPVRLRLLSLVADAAETGVCACDLTEPLERSQATVSHHTSMLVAAGFIEREQRGKWAWFRLAPERRDFVLAVLEDTNLRTTASKPSVLFLCVHNAGRSQMAAGWLSHLAGDSVEVLSGGSQPASTVNPDAVAAMHEVGIDISSSQPRPWTDADFGAADVVVTMGCGDECPFVPGKRYLDWELADPSTMSIEGVRTVRDDIGNRVRQLLAELGTT